jgi:hypothetical protein
MECPKCISLTIKIGWIKDLFNEVLINSCDVITLTIPSNSTPVMFDGSRN